MQGQIIILKAYRLSSNKGTQRQFIKEQSMTLDLNFVRNQYPVFQNPETAQWAFFENAGGSYVPRQVIERLNYFFSYTKVQPYGLFDSSVAAGEAMEAAYRCVAELLNTDPDQLTFGPSTTMNFYVLAQAFRPVLMPGDEIIVTNQDHEANIGCWRRLSEFGVVIKEWQIDPQSGELDIEDLKNLTGSRTRLVCFTLCSNIVGTMNDVSAINEIVHDAGALSIADGVSFAPHQLADVDRLGVDLYLFSTYKTFGTHIGVMWGKKEVLAKLESQGHYFNSDKPHYRLNPAGPLHAEIAALVGIGEYFDTLYEKHFTDVSLNRHQRGTKIYDLFAGHEARLANQLLNALQEIPGVRVIGQPQAAVGRRAATIAFIPREKKPSEIVKRLAENLIAVRNGHFYARRCVEALGLEDPDEGVIRVSLVHYNTEDEVERLIDGLRPLV
jgi:cysteine desulfurase family protein (TIGR01976 family)